MERAALEYLSLPEYVDTLVARNLPEPAFKAQLGAYFRDLFAPPLKMRMELWLAGVSLSGTEVAEFVDAIRSVEPAGRVSLDLRSPSSATANATIRVVEKYGLGFDLESTDWLFDRYKIENVSKADIARIVRESSDPEAIVFEVASLKRVAMTLVLQSARWKIADVRNEVVSSVLELKR